MLEAVTFAAALAECEVETEVHKSYRGYRFRRDDLGGAARAHGARADRASSRVRAQRAAAADANVFNERGLPCVNLANGMADIHTPDEQIAVADLERMVDVTLALVDAARETDAA